MEARLLLKLRQSSSLHGILARLSSLKIEFFPAFKAAQKLRPRRAEVVGSTHPTQPNFSC
jgi:hypothetical protein